MSNISAHMIVAKKVGERLGVLSDEYYRGNLLPDIIKKSNSHYRKINGLYLVPDINEYLRKVSVNNDLEFGYLIHLLLDKHYLEDYICAIYPEKNVFEDKRIYRDYDYLNQALVEYFKLDIERLSRLLEQFDMEIDEDKLKYNITCLKQNTSGIPIYLDFDSFASFLSYIPDTICEELVNYENKHHNMHVLTR